MRSFIGKGFWLMMVSIFLLQNVSFADEVGQSSEEKKAHETGQPFVGNGSLRSGAMLPVHSGENQNPDRTLT